MPSGPNTAIRNPAMAGPIRMAISRDGLSSAKAWTRSCFGTRAGMRDCRAGRSKVSAAVLSSTETRICHGSMTPISVSTASPRLTSSEKLWVICSSRNRFMRSAKAPPSGDRKIKAISLEQSDQTRLQGGVGERVHVEQVGGEGAPGSDLRQDDARPVQIEVAVAQHVGHPHGLNPP